LQQREWLIPGLCCQVNEVLLCDAGWQCCLRGDNGSLLFDLACNPNDRRKITEFGISEYISNSHEYSLFSPDTDHLHRNDRVATKCEEAVVKTDHVGLNSKHLTP